MARCIHLVLVIMWIYCLDSIRGHGKLVDPVSRSTMWRLGYPTPANYEDNQLFCGGVKVQYEDNGGKCGVCGDPYSGPLENETGGKYANGIIVRNYTKGQVIHARVNLTANHKGWFMFNLCPRHLKDTKETETCFNKYPLKIAYTEDVHFQVQGEWGSKSIVVALELPQNVACDYCVFRWKYNAGNSWGTDPVTKEGCIGCGPQEQFYGCADVRIFGDSGAVSVGNRMIRFLALSIIYIFHQTGMI